MDPMQPSLRRGRTNNVQQRTERMYDLRDTGSEETNTNAQNKQRAIDMMENIANDIVVRQSSRPDKPSGKDRGMIHRAAVSDSLPDIAVGRPGRPEARVQLGAAPAGPVGPTGPAAPTAVSWQSCDKVSPPAPIATRLAESSEEAGGAMVWCVKMVRRPSVMVGLVAVVVVLAVVIVAICTRS